MVQRASGGWSSICSKSQLKIALVQPVVIGVIISTLFELPGGSQGH